MKKFRPSNGSEGLAFMERFCDRCRRDDAFQRDPQNNDGCEIVANTMALTIDDERYPSEWTFDADGRPVCTAFEPIVESPR
ncbi:hypothetical protein [Methylocystis rosea]|uniref:hypothetical protein n=1 Tax=Methylocystis rosea TaxID=173366 RepID=UPI000382C2BD|nr:hypothetical protein [Methylocystis rosea]